MEIKVRKDNKMIEIDQIQNSNAIIHNKNHDLVKDKTITVLENSKLNTLYSEIITLFNEKKPYQDSNFNMRNLAEMLDSNTTYVSVALNKIGDKKFSQLVNEYRIKHVLENLEEGLHHKFTIEYIYKDAGFSQQSTFNRIFKEQTGFTPSKYIENLSGGQNLENSA